LNLPVRIVGTPPGEPVISVDGAFDAPGLNLSHWPGNRTPAALRHDLSTGSALAFASLGEDERLRLAPGATAIVNNHYDTDGICALFAVSRPRSALERQAALIAAARCGDFYQVPDEAAFRVDALLTRLADPAVSPLRTELQGLADLERWNLATGHALLDLASILDGDVDPYRDLWEEPLEDLRHDLADLRAAERQEDPALSLTTWTARGGSGSSRGGTTSFDPGRHALFGSTGFDRVLSLGPGAHGTTARLIFSTRSWFDLVSERLPQRPDLSALVQTLNECEGTDLGGAVAWRTQDPLGASPELWFGTEFDERFSEHSPALEPSALAIPVLLAVLRPALASRV